MALVIVVESLPFRPCFVVGEPVAVGQLLREAMHEPRIVVAAPLPARGAIESVYRFERSDTMYRMVVDASSFEPRESHPVVRLDPERLDDVIDLYGNASRSYFTCERLARELYFGAYAGASLVSAAGTHVRSRSAGIAAVGNVLTRLAYRGRGMATACSSAVTSAALEGHRDVVLNVRRDNTTAIAVYRRLGYRVHASFVEGPAIRRTGWERLAQNIFGRNE
ncbi:MAG: GNAT family N-acetyltransferase [Chloroflexota bacterium]|nr:GNAT family N-acetyltransferase [Chloroflexota bacterium]